MTVARAHGLYMRAVPEGRASRAKPRTISDKLEIYERDIAPALVGKIIYDVTERDLIRLVEKKGRTAKVRANRLAAELKVFFGWAASLRGLEVGIEIDPSRRLGDLRFPETPAPASWPFRRSSGSCVASSTRNATINVECCSGCSQPRA